MEDQYKKYLVNILYNQALSMDREELQTTSFYDEETITDNWSLERLNIEYVKDQIGFFEGGNLDDEIKETWNTVFKRECV